MKVLIPFHSRAAGGSATFFNQFREALNKKEIETVTEYSKDCDVAFIMGSAPILNILKWKRQGVKIIQRLDGIYYARVKALYPLWNFRMKFIHNHLADYVVYQSQYSKFLCQKFFKRRPPKSCLIYNGVNIEKFSPQRPQISFRDNPRQVILITASQFRREDMIVPLLKVVEELKKYVEDFKLLVCGEITHSLKKKIKRYSDNSNIYFLGKMDHSKLADYMRGSDIFLFSDSSACPNSVLEAMACGLPVVAYDRASARELVKPGCGEIILHDSNEWWRLKEFDTTAFCLGIKKVLNDLKGYKKRARANVEQHFSLEKMISHYIRLLK